ncbi:MULTISPECIES: hypothetical protein [unclassified Paraburkholderia]|uniref:hypothetical protein n=1 Tax=unclassified Paraburkholderia TaxID=2615204 RepID=UPI002AB29C2B|nr:MULTISPECIES: hypothetical protein [unclassified Paraburkholderia]
MTEKSIHVHVVSPVYNDQCYGSYTNSLLDLQGKLLRAGHEFSFNWSKNISRIAKARNLLFNHFLLDQSATHLLFVDSDIVFKAPDVMKMLEYDHDIMVALYSRKTINWELVIKAVKNNPDLTPGTLPLLTATFGTFNPLPGNYTVKVDEPLPIAAGGTGLMLIRRGVFTKMIDAYPELMEPVSPLEAPYFPGIARLSALFNEITLPDGVTLGEDISFCKRWRDIGGEIFGCPWVKTSHLGTYEYTSDIRSIAEQALFD